MPSGYMIYIVLTIGLSFVGMWVSSQLKSRFKKYSQIPLSAGLSGSEVARKMLSDHGITDVKVVQGQGTLTDHYNPATRTVSLSPAVYQGRSIASAAVAAHECGHAVQHADAYAFLQMRSAIVPIVSVAARAQQFLLMGALLFFSAFPSLLLITIIAFAITTLFSLITLPVEFDASKRALVWLNKTELAHGREHDGAKDALNWAAMTYVAAALSSLIILLFLIIRFANR